MGKAKYTKNGPSSKKKDLVGAGDFYGSGVKNPLGKLRSTSLGPNAATTKQLKKPPKSLA